MSPTRLRILCGVVYVAAMIAVVVMLFRVREHQTAALSQPQARADWQKWRAAAAKQTGKEGPVQRKPPKSVEPPALVLLRDHFGVVLAAGLVFGTALFALALLTIRGMLARAPPLRSDS